jgi:hypothetical protein
MQTLEKTKGIEVLKEACAACGEAITARKGRMIVKDEARVVSISARALSLSLSLCLSLSLSLSLCVCVCVCVCVCGSIPA